MTDLRDLTDRMYQALNQRDLPAVAAMVGTYQDPDLAEPVRGDELCRHLDGALRGLAGLRFDPRRLLVQGDHAAVFWDLHPAAGTTATEGVATAAGGSRAVGTRTGVDEVQRLGGDRLAVRRTFDRLAALPAPEPASTAASGPTAAPEPGREPGTSARFTTGRTGGAASAAGALVLTRLSTRDPAESNVVDQLSVEVIRALRASRGFAGAMTADIGLDKYTFSAFTDPAAVRAVHGRAHQRAVRRFFQGGLCQRSTISVWVPASRHEYVRCDGCAAVQPVPPQGAICGCGLPLVALLDI